MRQNFFLHGSETRERGSSIDLVCILISEKVLSFHHFNLDSKLFLRQLLFDDLHVFGGCCQIMRAADVCRRVTALSYCSLWFVSFNVLSVIIYVVGQLSLLLTLNLGLNVVTAWTNSPARS